jgi:glycerol-3-phosphate dehydrogenase
VKVLDDNVESIGSSRTKRMPLRGADGYETAALGGDERAVHLAGRHGGDARVLLAMIDKDPTLGEPLVAGLPYLKAEAVYAAIYEMARNVDDVLSRRTRARILARDAADEAAPEVAALIGPVLGLSDTEKAAQVADYRARSAAERSPLDVLV